MTFENESGEDTRTKLLTEEGRDASFFLVSVSGAKYSDHLFKALHEMEIPIRAHSAFANAGMVYLGDLLNTPFKELISIADLGRKALEIVGASLRKLGLRFDMEIESWPPSDLLDLRKQYETMLTQMNDASSDWSDETANISQAMEP